MKAGDLICYNAAGMKYKTLGLVVEIEDNRVYPTCNRNTVLIQWCVIGEYMPRREWRDQKWNPREPIQPGQFVWHEIGDWLEVVK